MLSRDKIFFHKIENSGGGGGGIFIFIIKQKIIKIRRGNFLKKKLIWPGLSFIFFFLSFFQFRLLFLDLFFFFLGFVLTSAFDFLFFCRFAWTSALGDLIFNILS